MGNKGNQTGYDVEGDIDALYNPGFADSGNAAPREPSAVPYSGHDLRAQSKVTLGNYLSAVTKGNAGVARPNSFSVPGGSSDLGGTGQSVDPNASSNLSPGEAKEQMRSAGTTLGTFLDLAKSYSAEAGSRFESTKDSQYSKNINPFVDTNIKKVGSADRTTSLQDGHSLLTGISAPEGVQGAPTDLGAPSIAPPPDDAPVVQRKISEVLRNNRFSAVEKAFVQNHTRSVPGGYSIQRKMGAYDPDAPAVDEESLKTLGKLLVVRSTGHASGVADVLQANASLTDIANIVPFVPSLSQLTGLPIIDTVNLQAGNVPLKDAAGAEIPLRTEYINQENAEFSPFSGKSYGNLNSQFEPFDGVFPIGTLTTTVGNIFAILAFAVVIGGIPLIIGAAAPDTMMRSDSNPKAPWEMVKGRYLLRANDSAGNFISEMLGIPLTTHPWGECMFVGLANFLGFADSVSVGSSAFAGISEDSLFKACFDLVTAPGYYAAVLRNAVRDIQQVVQSISDLAGNFSGGDILGGIVGIFKMIESITSSATFRFLMQMVSLGDRVLEESKSASVDSRIGPRSRAVKSRIAQIDDIGADDIGRRDVSALVWKHSATPSQYIFPDSFKTSKLSARSLTSTQFWSQAFKWTEGSRRISADQVEEIENRLDAEYVPFYFHDMRTNEVISFHAFLSDLSDGFTASYTETAGYGRADSVMTYNSTKRSISFTFTVAATSPEDLDVMYWNINKLVSMLYPQYSRGRAMQDNNLKFIQPFSQIPTASPMIRIRIGDVIKGNYSKFGLARLFGLGQSSNVFNADRVSPESSSGASSSAAPPTVDVVAQATEQIRIEEDIKSYDVDLGFSVGDIVIIQNERHSWRDRDGSPPAPGRGTIPQNRRIITYSNPPYGTIVAVYNSTPGIAGAATLQLDNARSRRAREDESFDRAISPQFTYVIKIDESLIPENRRSVISDNYRHHVVHHSDITGYTDAYRQQRINDEISQRTASTPEASAAAAAESNSAPQDLSKLQSFLNSSNNPVVRSFESTRGRGLAGFITDLKMDWGESTWEVDPEIGRAPTVMKLSVSFSPVHDIPMGLDSDGMMRSVAYNVGSLSREIGSDPYTELGPNDSAAETRTNSASASTAATSEESSTAPTN